MNPNPIILKADQVHAAIVHQNGHYESDIRPTLVLEDGDIITARNDFIDTNQLSAATFVFEEDEIITVSGILYEANTSDTGKAAVTGALAVDYNIYQMQLSDPTTKGMYHIMTQTITVPAGPYEPVRLAELITNKLSYVAPLRGSDLIETGSNMLINSLSGFGGGVSNINFANPVFVNREFFGNNADYWDNPMAQFWSDAPGNHNPPEKDHYQDITPVISSGAGTGMSIRIFLVGPENKSPSPAGASFFTISAPGSNYALGDTLTFTSDQFGYWRLPIDGNDFYQRCPAGGSVTYSITNIKDTDAFYEMVPVGDIPNAPIKSYKYTDQVFMGASEVDLQFTTTFEWDFLHTPEYDTATTPAQPAVSIVKDTTDEWHTIDRASGFAITGLSPASLWESMGFDIDALVCKVTNPTTGALENITTSTPNTYPIDAGSFERSTTKSYLGLNAMLNNKVSNGSRTVPTTDIIEATTLTVPISAPNYKVDTGSGHFIVQIFGGYDQTTYTSEGKIQIGAIVSKQWGTNDIITGFLDSGIQYQHFGVPMTLSRFEIKIVDGASMEVPSTLGNNQCVYLQVQKAASARPARK